MNTAQFANLCDQLAELKEAVMSTKKPARPRTLNRGADDERAAIKRNAINCFAEVNYMDATVDDYIRAFRKHINYIEGRAKRNAERPGGLGRKRKP